MLGDGALTLREFLMREPLPLAEIHDAVLAFLRARDDVALFGAQAVNAYVEEPRMSQDVDVLSTRAAALAEELRVHLADRFRIAVRLRQSGEGSFRLYQVRRPRNRHLVDVRHVAQLPPTRRIERIAVVTPEVLIATKVQAYHARRGAPKSGTDWRDLALLLLAYPALQAGEGPVRTSLESLGADAEVLATWDELAAQEIRPEPEEGA